MSRRLLRDLICFGCSVLVPVAKDRTRSEAGCEAKLDAACIIDLSPYTPYEHTNSYRISFVTLLILRWCSVLVPSGAMYYRRSYVRGDLGTGSFMDSSTYDLICSH